MSDLLQLQFFDAGDINPKTLRASNHAMLNIPAAKQINKSAGASSANLNTPRRKGTHKTSARKLIAPLNTHHSAAFGVRSVEKTVLDHERFVRIRARLATIKVVKDRARATSSPRLLIMAK
jgi:hypothetical protein